MIDETRDAVPEAVPARNTGALLLAAGGVAAAFGAASCYALPLLLASLGVGSAWLAAVAWFAAPHRPCRRVPCGQQWHAALAPPPRRQMRIGRLRSPVTTSVLTSFLLVGAVLVVLGWMFA